ncbi:Hypothetical predicted protein [Xyrichtys novacula]|uniref:Uncharacterized protein n=1 Tax=Xyrichtys novacula TaxID=13765 RepID=A0AAV1F158_XYRNO|nr:Hypothetical predicted protein [Xyrichtys novacula]
MSGVLRKSHCSVLAAVRAVRPMLLASVDCRVAELKALLHCHHAKITVTVQQCSKSPILQMQSSWQEELVAFDGSCQPKTMHKGLFTLYGVDGVGSRLPLKKLIQLSIFDSQCRNRDSTAADFFCC